MLRTFLSWTQCCKETLLDLRIRTQTLPLAGAVSLFGLNPTSTPTGFSAGGPRGPAAPLACVCLGVVCKHKKFDTHQQNLDKTNSITNWEIFKVKVAFSFFLIFIPQRPEEKFVCIINIEQSKNETRDMTISDLQKIQIFSSTFWQMCFITPF